MDRLADATKFKPVSKNSQIESAAAQGMTAKKCHEVKPSFVLNPYDSTRNAHTSKAQIRKDETVIIDRFKDEITCSVCKKILQNPFLITPCMHRVCKTCLPVKEAHKKCPICEKEIRKISHDRNFELLISKLIKREKNIPRLSVLEVLEANGVEFDLLKKGTILNDRTRADTFIHESNKHFCEPSTSNNYARDELEEPKIKHSRSGSPSSRLVIDESPEPDDELYPPALNSEVVGNHISNHLPRMVKPSSIQPPPILVSSPSKGPPTFIVLPKESAMYAMNTQTNGTFASNSSNEYNETTLSNSECGIKGQYITPNVHPSTSLKRPYPVNNVPTSSNLSRLTPIKPKFSQHDIIQIRTPGCWINFRAEQLNILPLVIDPSSLVRLSGNSLEPNFNNVISLCDNEPPNYSAALAVTQPTTVEMTPELRNLLAQLPPTVIELLPECCREKQLIKPVFADELAINVRRQRLSRGMFAPLILWPDGSIYKEDLPTCTKHPRYIYTTLDASVGHLVEYILKRTEIEANWNQRDKYTVEITHLDEEKDEVVLLLSSKTKECFNQPGLESAEFLSLKVDEGLFNTMIAISQPFTALSPMLTVADLFKHYHPNKKRPLKVVYRFVQNEG